MCYILPQFIVFTPDIAKNSLPALNEGPVEWKDVHKRRSQERELNVQPSLQRNPSYDPLEVCVRALEVKDAQKKTCVPEEQETNVDTKCNPTLPMNH